MVARLSTLLALAASTFASPLAGEKRSPKQLTLMSMGASISYGYKSSDGNGYRTELTKLLKADGTTPTWVGHQHNGDYDVESTAGFVISQCDSDWNNNKAWELKPDVILINVGNNNCVNKHTQQEIDSAVTAGGKDYTTLLSDIKTHLPSAAVYVSSLLVSGDKDHNTCDMAMSKKIFSVADSAKAGGQKIVKVDLYPVLTASELQDGTHPTDAGYSKLGDAWFKSLKANGL